jgi:flagellin-like protein
MNKKRGVSPVIATILLIGIVVAIGVIIFLWVRSFVQEEGTKFDKNIRLVCDDVNFDADYSNGILSISNVNGNVPLFRVKVELYSSGSFVTKDITDLSSNWPSTGLSQGAVFSDTIGDTTGVNKIMIVPVLLGKTGSGEKTFTCADNYGKQVM